MENVIDGVYHSYDGDRIFHNCPIFFVSRFYVITDYTRQRIETIQKRSEEISQYGFSELKLSETSEIRNLLDRFEAENNVFCLLMDSTGDVICKSDMMYSENSLS